MSTGKRRARLLRATLRPTTSVSLSEDRLARQRIQLALLVLVGVSLAVTAALVHGSGPPFTHRLGEKPDRELRVNVKEFRIRNQTKTSNERQAAADQVAPVMLNDPAPLRNLGDLLDELTGIIAKTPRYEDLREALRTAWKLSPQAVLELQSASKTPERREVLHRELAIALQPIIENGVLGPGTLPPNEESSRNLAVRQVTQPNAIPKSVPRDRVVIDRMILPDGAVSQEFIARFHDPRVGKILFNLIAARLDGTPTLSYDAEATARLREKARGSVADHYDTYTRGEVLVEQGQTIGEEQLILLRLEHDAATAALTLGDRARRATGILGLVTALFVLTGYFVCAHESRIARDPQRIATICGLVILAVAAVRLLAMETWHAELVPIAVAAMIIAIAHNPNFALMITFGLSLLTCIALGSEIPEFLILMGGTAAGVLSLSEVRTRTKLIKVGATASLAYFLMTWATGLWQDRPLELVRNDSFWRAGWGLMAGFFLGGSLPFLENALGIVTGISLLELGDNTHPCSKSSSAAPPALTTTRSPSDPSPKPPPNASVPTPSSSASALISTTSARCSNLTTSSKTRSEAPAAMPS